MNKQNSPKISEKTKKDPPIGNQMTLKCLQMEYQNIFERSNKLDNKVYIALTFCGFLFVFITGLFSGISRLQIPTHMAAFIVTGLYILTCIFVMIAYAYALVKFIKLLSPEELVRFEPDFAHQDNLNSSDEERNCAELCEIYIKLVSEDLKKLEHRCHEYTSCLKFIPPTVVLAFAAYVLQILLQMIG